MAVQRPPVPSIPSHLPPDIHRRFNPFFTAQVRAANLSGDCSFGQELLRGNLSESIIGQQKRCVQRRALLSVSLNPYCQGEKAELAVNDMMRKCFKDTDPFPKIP